VDELLQKLAAQRRRIRGARVADAALRWTFYASVAACLALLVSKFAGVALPMALAAAALAALPAAMALREWTRAFSIHDCAIHLDRLLGLEERLSTALETPGGMGAALRADATGALSRAPLPRHSLPREARLLAGSVALLAALLAIPSPDRSGATVDPVLKALSLEEAKKLESLAHLDVQFKEVADALPEHPEKALAGLDELRARLAAKLLLESGGDGSRAETQRMLDQATASAAAISAELARLGRTVHAPPPAVAQAKLARQKAVEESAPEAASAASSGARRAAASSSSVPWNPRYDPVIRRYFGREP
jgi:hypothetical protein